MGRLIDVQLTGTTNAQGAATINGPAVFGRLYAVRWIDGTLADGNDAVLSYTDADGSSVTLLTLTDADIDKMYYPREKVQGNTGADLDTAYDLALVAGPLKLAITGGGSGGIGGCVVYVLEER